MLQGVGGIMGHSARISVALFLLGFWSSRFHVAAPDVSAARGWVGSGVDAQTMSVASSQRPIRVLVVDDEPNHRRCLALGLRLEGFIIAEAADASCALAELAAA